MARIEIDTHDYERSHGKTPRGYGSWAFSATHPGSREWRIEQARFFHGSWGEARRQAIAWAKAEGLATLYALS